VTRNGGTNGFESSDRKFIYYAKGRYGAGASLWKIPMDGGDETQVLESLVSLQDFVVVDEGIYFIPMPAVGPSCSINLLSFATGKIRPVAKTGRPAMLGLTVSPDSRCILYTQLDQDASELMLVENFR